MSEFKRKQGRPSKADGEVGRSRIVRLVQDLLRAEPRVDFSRKLLAKKIGVTPALITYYFPQRIHLFAEVAMPVIEQYASKLRSIIEAELSSSTKFRSVIQLLLDLYALDRRFIDIYKEVIFEVGGDSALDEMHALLADYLTTHAGGKKRQSFEAAVLQGAVQGMCDFVARAEASEATITTCVYTSKTSRIDQLQTFFSSTPAFASLAA